MDLQVLIGDLEDLDVGRAWTTSRETLFKAETSDGEVIQGLRYFLCKHEDWGLGRPNPHKHWVGMIATYNSSFQRQRQSKLFHRLSVS